MPVRHLPDRVSSVSKPEPGDALTALVVKHSVDRSVLSLEVIHVPAAAILALDPLRARILAELREPASAAALAQRVGLARQKVNYHVRALEAHHLVTVASERKHGGLTERLLVATAASYVVCPSALGTCAADPARVSDRLSARYLIALGARIVREVGGMVRRADALDARAPTLAIDTEIGFATPQDRAQFAEELARTVTQLAAKYHHDDGWVHRLVVAAHPVPGSE
jgi:DNA-binding transcriptional ArsR family regulator